LPEPLQSGQIDVVDPTREHLLLDFSCGGSTPYEREVDEIVEQYRNGHQAPFLQFTMAHGPRTGELYGVCAVFARWLPDVSPAAMYVGVIGVAEGARGRRLPGDVRLGDRLLEDALARVDASWLAVPPVWALIDPENHPSLKLFARHGFSELPLRGKYAVVYRPQKAG
jgi:ribosomal protein S18 acetylase RimI-like enzyme